VGRATTMEARARTMPIISTLLPAMGLGLALAVVSPALAAEAPPCDEAAVSALRARLPEMTNDDARDVAKARLDEAEALRAASNLEACRDALERARKDIGIK
jgi:hypothetical protein